MDSVEAVTACDSCLNAHVAVLLIRTVWSDPVEIPEPATFVWTQADGEGTE